MRFARIAVLSLGVVAAAAGVISEGRNSVRAFGPGGGPTPTCPLKSCPTIVK